MCMHIFIYIHTHIYIYIYIRIFHIYVYSFFGSPWPSQLPVETHLVLKSGEFISNTAQACSTVISKYCRCTTYCRTMTTQWRREKTQQG